MNFTDDKTKVEIKELITLIKLNEKYTSVLADGVFPIDQKGVEIHSQRKVRIHEITRKYGLA